MAGLITVASGVIKGAKLKKQAKKASKTARQVTKAGVNKAGKQGVLSQLKESGAKHLTVALICVLIAVYLAGGIIKGTGDTIAHFANFGIRNNVCAAETTGGSPGSNDQHGGGDTSSERWSTASTPWPEQDSKAVVYPVPAPALTSGWGYRPPFNVGGVLTPGYHNGLDFGQGQGTPVLAMADGVVATAEAGTSLYGSHVAVKHKIGGKQFTSVYGHIIGSSIKVKKGQTVKAGQQIAGVGMEGMSTAPHLHFVLTLGDYAPSKSEPSMNGGDEGNTVDPASFLRSKGASVAGGGITGDDFEGGVENSGIECIGTGSEGLLDGDGFGSWGGQENGNIQDIRQLGFDKSKWLYSQAATEIERLNTDYRAKFGTNLPVLRAYESRATQEAKGDIVGKSMFGWGRAVKLDLKFGTPEYEWVKSAGKAFGWEQPANFQQGGSVATPTLWGFVGVASSIPPASSPGAEKSRAFAKSYMATQYSWNSKEYSCVVNLWERESNWNYQADNPTSDAYGIPQALPGEKMATAGSDWKTNGNTQVKWGLGYIAERYGTPCEAWAFWQETDPAKKSGIGGNWY